jgi:hypothetical protein
MEEADVVHLIRDKIGLQNFLQQILKALEKGFKQFAVNQIVVPSRQEFYFSKGTMESMPASDRDYFSCQIVNTHLENPSKFGIPTIIARGLLVDGNTDTVKNTIQVRGDPEFILSVYPANETYVASQSAESSAVLHHGSKWVHEVFHEVADRTTLLVVWLVVSLILVDITFLKLLYSLPHFPSFTTTAKAKSTKATTLHDDDPVVEGCRLDDGRRVLGVRASVEVALSVGLLGANQCHVRHQVHEHPRVQFDVGVNGADLELSVLERLRQA